MNGFAADERLDEVLQPGAWCAGEVVHARKPARLPVVMTREEVTLVLANLNRSGAARTQRCSHDHDLYTRTQLRPRGRTQPPGQTMNPAC